jgi:putative transcriptional regulator
MPGSERPVRSWFDRRDGLQGLLLVLAAVLGLLAPASAADAIGDSGPRSLLLVAAERLGDPNFSRTVVLVTQHGGGGPIGVVLNRATDVALAEVFPGEPALQGRKEKLFRGGPVASATLVFMLRADQPPAKTVELVPGLHMGFDSAEALRRLREGAADVRVFAGYAGWAPGQLEKEIAHGDWHLLPADAEVIMSREPQGLWEQLRPRAPLKWIGKPVSPLAQG